MSEWEEEGVQGGVEGRRGVGEVGRKVKKNEDSVELLPASLFYARICGRK